MAPTCSSYPLGFPRAVFWLGLALAALATVACGYALVMIALNPAGQSWRAIVLVLAWVLAICALWRHYQKDAKGQLRFDGERWWFRATDHKGTNRVVFDEQAVRVAVLVQFSNQVWLRLQWDHVPEGHTSKTFFAWACQGHEQGLESWLNVRRALVFDARTHKPVHSPLVP